ncbi:hypothetical protein PPACK8108_LOCUS23913 [Phakopsora pachyrhizi]|uniref:Uncharacterized protein n=1 Tax=Phakopsora pachyrhizi TaxID=170000 RepID=A0AAV0BTG4_PHAPC|nr:hypothetical protein PPACK8108_LOCUS23913 [Phakopsora pachyrhizi]
MEDPGYVALEESDPEQAPGARRAPISRKPNRKDPLRIQAICAAVQEGSLPASALENELRQDSSVDDDDENEGRKGSKDDKTIKHWPICPQKITKIMINIKLAEGCGIALEAQSLRLLGFAALHAQKWEAFCKILKEKELLLLDLTALVKISCCKVLFYSLLKDQEAHIEVLVTISQAVFSTSPDLDCTLSPLVTQTVQQIANSMTKLSGVDLASEFVLQMLCCDSDLAECFESTFLHCLMVTCPSHQRLNQAHLILNKIPSHLQTLEYYKACMTVWRS